MEWPPSAAEHNFNLKTQCHVLRVVYDADKEYGELVLPEMNSPDMNGTIELFTGISPRVQSVHVITNGQLSMLYYKYKGKWSSFNTSK